jgi:hypothetical protein
MHACDPLLRIEKGLSQVNVVGLVYCRWESVQDQKVEVINELFELHHCQVADPLYIIQVENLVCFLTGMILAQQDQ